MGKKGYYKFSSFDRSMPLLQKKIDKKKWSAHGETPSKRQATKEAEKIRDKGGKARIIYDKPTKQYLVYTPFKSSSKPKKKRKKRKQKEPWYNTLF